MAFHSGTVFSNQTVQIDGNTFTNCTFKNGCVLKFSGGTLTIKGGSIEPSCQFVLDGPAESTVKFLAALYGGGLQAQVEAFVDAMRRNAFPIA
jgi:hypothetical protein